MDEAVTQDVVKQVNRLLAEFEEQKKLRNKSCAHLGTEALNLAKLTGDKDLITKACSELTHYYSEITNEFAKSIETIKEVMPFYNEKDDAVTISEYYRRIGLNYDYLGAFIESKDAYDESVRLLEGKPDLDERGTLTLARSYLNQSIIYQDLGLTTLTKDYLQKAFECFQKVNDKGGLARCYISFGVFAHKNGDTEKALENYQKAIELVNGTNDVPPFCIATANSGLVNAECGRKSEAIECIEKAIARVRNQVNKHFELSIYFLAGRTYQIVGEYELANKWFSEAENCYREMGKVVENFDIYRYWAESLAELGKHREANEKLLHYIKQREEMHKLNKLAEINDTKLRLQLEEGKKEQELLKKKNAEIESYARKLEAMNYDLTQFVHVASHDMKEPLRMVTNYSQLLTRSLGDNITPEQTDYLKFLNDGAKHMLNVINSLLSLSKINAVEHREEVCMNDVLNEVKQLLHDEIVKNNAVIHADKLPSVNAERTYMVRLLQNLIGNALKYNESKVPKVHIYYKPSEREHLFSIADNGIGIPAPYRQKVFIMFQRLHRNHEYQGSGIGLAICKKIIDSLNGKIWIEDSPLGGTCICFTIPC
ncbi:MAG: ATP-binding protein [Chitinophagales bacterium]|nr:ATP-binding protein [Chitinophagales bacterium]MDW8418668.1 ATP-binding protein [Chitinophagales bacterium]